MTTALTIACFWMYGTGGLIAALIIVEAAPKPRWELAIPAIIAWPISVVIIGIMLAWSEHFERSPARDVQ